MNTTLGLTNEKIMREFNDVVFENGDMALLEERLAPGFVQYDAGVETVRGIDAAREYFEGLLTAFPESTLDVEEMVADDDRVMVRYEMTEMNTVDDMLGMARQLGLSVSA